MRSLHDTGAHDMSPDKLVPLSSITGKVFIITVAPRVVEFGRFPGKPKAILEGLLEGEQDSYAYISGSARLVMQAEQIARTWQDGEYVRAVVRTAKTAHGTYMVWLEEAPASTSAPTEKPEETAAQKIDRYEQRARQMAIALHLDSVQGAALKKQFTRSDGVIDWRGMIQDLERIGRERTASKRKEMEEKQSKSQHANTR